MESFIQEELERGRALVSPEWTGIALNEHETLVEPEHLGAQAGIGFSTDTPEVNLYIYVFESQSQHPAAVSLLRSRVPGESIYSLAGSNGLLLFFGFTDLARNSGQEQQARDWLNRLGQAAGGEE